MQTQALGGGLLLAVAALLWALYFLPTWAKRRQFRTAEHNALRIQRTLRMLAETSEVPDEVRLEASAKAALAQERLLASSERIAVAEQRARLAEAKLAERKAALEAREAKRQAALMRRELLKRTRLARAVRAVMAVLALFALIGMGTGLVFGAMGLGWAVVSASAGALLVSVLTLLTLAPMPQQLLEHKTRPRSVVTPPVAVVNPAPTVRHEVPRVRQHTPERTVAAQVPRQRPAADLTPASAEEVAAAKLLLERARATAEAQQRRAATQAAESGEGVRRPAPERAPQRATQRTPLRPGEPELGQRTRLNAMGVLDDMPEELPNLDQALQRRRAAS